MSLKSRLQMLGRWPKIGEESRKSKQMTVIKPDGTLDLIHGSKNHMLVCFAVSNDYIHSGSMTIPPGVCSDGEVHKGDEVFYVLEGTVSVGCVGPEFDPKSTSKPRYEVKQGERFLIPEKTIHHYMNHTSMPAKIIFAIAPEL